MNWNYRTRRRIAIIAMLVIGLMGIVIGFFMAHQDKTTGTVIVISALTFMVMMTIYIRLKNEQND